MTFDISRWELDWLLWPMWFGFGLLDKRADWFYCLALGPLLITLYRKDTYQ